MVSDTVSLAQELIRIPSLTPADLGCQKILATRLVKQGFHLLDLSSKKVTNLLLWRTGKLPGPTLLFSGHTDVVPSGVLSGWDHDPFSAEIVSGVLYGRGAADMKGALAAMTTATERFLSRVQQYAGTLAFAFTSDEEGEAMEGTQRIVSYLTSGEVIPVLSTIDYCIIGEASSEKKLGDQIRVGRRGSLHGRLVFQGATGHVAYTGSKDNVLHKAFHALSEWCQQDFGDSVSCHLYSISAGSKTVTNMTPDNVEACFNMRFGADQEAAVLQAKTEDFFAGLGLRTVITWNLSSRPFASKKGRLTEVVSDVIQSHQGAFPVLSTGGGTSDGRFLIQTGAEVVELGCLHRTIHQHNECVSIAELEQLSHLYEGILQKLFPVS